MLDCVRRGFIAKYFVFPFNFPVLLTLIGSFSGIASFECQRSFVKRMRMASATEPRGKLSLLIMSLQIEFFAFQQTFKNSQSISTLIDMLFKTYHLINIFKNILPALVSPTKSF